jgi:hypothetical protein
MTHYYSADACEDDSIMIYANEQLARELLQSQESPLDAFPVSRRVVSLGISTGYVKDWIPEQMLFGNCFKTGTC